MAKKYLILSGGLAFLFGVIVASLSWNLFLTIFLSTFSLIFYLKFGKNRFRKKEKIFLEVIILFFIFTGFFYYHLRINLELNSEKINYSNITVSEGTVIKEPELNEKSQRLTVDLLPPQNGRIIIIIPFSERVIYGDQIKTTGKMEPRENVSTFPQLVFPKLEIISHAKTQNLKSVLINFKNYIISQFQKYLPSDEAALLSGLTIGSRVNFSNELKTQMSQSGTTHLVALSGYNIAILILGISAILKRFFSRRLNFLITVIFIILFVVMVGGEASIVRAALMGFIVLLAREIGRPHDTAIIIIFTATIMVLINPKIIFYNLAFQLSFLSLLGIVYLAPALKKILFKNIDEKTDFLSWRENLLTTISAQLTVAPLIIQSFNQFSLTAILANVLILSTVPITMLFGLILFCASTISFYFGFFISKILHLFLAYQIGIIKIFSSFRIPIGNYFNSKFVFLIYYLIIIGIIITKSIPKKQFNSADEI